MKIQKQISQHWNPFSDFSFDCKTEIRILKSKSRFPNRTHPKTSPGVEKFLRSASDVQVLNRKKISSSIRCRILRTLHVVVVQRQQRIFYQEMRCMCRVISDQSFISTFHFVIFWKTNRMHHEKLLAKRLYLNSHIAWFRPQTQKLEPPYNTSSPSECKG